MSRYFRSLIVVLFGLVVTGTVAAAAEVRAPLGDSYLTAVAIPLNGSKTITGVETATLQGPTFEETSCDVDDDSTHSVWFGFTVESGVTIDLDSSGTIYTTAMYTTDLSVLSLYSLNGLALTHVGCISGYGARLTDIYVTPGSYRVRLAYEDNQTLVGPSQARLSLRLRSYDNLVDDPGFDEPLGVQWKIQSENQLLIVRSCGVSCKVRFDGVAGGTIKDTIRMPDSLKIKKGDFLSLTGNFNGTPGGGSNVKLKLKISYSDGTPPTSASVVRNFVNTNTSNSPTTGLGYFEVEIKSKAILKVQVSVTSPQASDTFNVWYMWLSMNAGGSVRESAALPAPLAAK